MKKQTKLLSLLAAVLVAATVATTPAFADAPTRFVLIDWNRTGGGYTDVTINEYDNHSQRLRGSSHNAEHESGYWIIDETYPDAKGEPEEIFFIEVAGGGHTYDIYPKGVPANARTDTTNVSGLPSCFRVSYTGKLHHKEGGNPCDTGGASEFRWN